MMPGPFPPDAGDPASGSSASPRGGPGAPPVERLDARIGRVRDAVAAAGLDVFVVSSVANLFYLTGVRSSAGLLVLTHSALVLLIDGRYRAAVAERRGAGALASGLEVEDVDGSYEEALAAVLRRLDRARIGLEGAHTSLARYRWLLDALGRGEHGGGVGTPALVATDRLVERIRCCKDDYEVQVLREAAARLSAQVPEVVRCVRPGRSERDIAAEIDWLIVHAGFERPAFKTMVASGPHSAQPHARPTRRQVECGDLVVLDFGGVYDGYCVDFARTVSLGEPSEGTAHLLDAVGRAQRAAIAAVRPGALASEIDAAARQVLDAAGLGEAFPHATGHGVGVEVHEEPRVRRRQPPRPAAPTGGVTPGVEDPAAGDADDARLASGMVMTIEPGAYRPGVAGARVEDVVLVTDEGGEVLTRAAFQAVVPCATS